MIILAFIIGFLYGNVSTKGQFCMNSGFSNVTRRKDTTKLKSYITAILVQVIIIPLLFVLLYNNESTNHLISNIDLPAFSLTTGALGGFFFGVFMYYSAGCGAGIFYKIGEKNTGAVIAALGFILGIFLTQKGALNFLTDFGQNTFLIDQAPLWKGNAALRNGIIAATTAGIILYWLFKKEDKKPGSAAWGWKKTGIAIGLIGAMGWISAIAVHNPYGMSIIPGAMDLTQFNLSWALLFVLGIPFGAFWNSRKNKTKKFTVPATPIIAKRLAGGLGLGVSGSIAAGCTVGHGLTFTPLLSIGSVTVTFFIFLGSGLVGFLTRK